MNMSLPLSDAEEAQLLSNLLSDPDDLLSARLLELHYQSTKGKILNEKTYDQWSTNEYSRSIRSNWTQSSSCDWAGNVARSVFQTISHSKSAHVYWSRAWFVEDESFAMISAALQSFFSHLTKKVSQNDNHWKVFTASEAHQNISIPMRYGLAWTSQSDCYYPASIARQFCSPVSRGSSEQLS